MEAVENVLAELNVKHIPRLTVWNKVNTEDIILALAIYLS
jgi:50S ribosomal subunit-associated GTPase HflX